MNHVTSKLYSILSLPIVYHIFQKIMKGDQMRKKIITAELKEFKEVTKDRLNKLESWIIAIVGLTFTTLVTTVVGLLMKVL